MKKLRFLIFAIIITCCLAALAGCGLPKLSKPVGLTVDQATLTLSWRKITNAGRYKVSINGTERDTRENSYSLANLAEGEYTLAVKAVGDGEETKDSDWSDELTFVREAENGLVYTLRNKSEYEVTGIGTAVGAITVPDTYRGKPVTSIGNRAFYNRAKLTSIVLGENIKKIGAYAFANCSLLTSVTLPEGLTSIGEFAFQSCKLISGVIEIPEGVTEISKSAFEYCRLISGVKLHTGIVSIGESAFADCENLQSIAIPDGVETVGKSAFSGCVAAKTLSLGRNLKTIDSNAFANCKEIEEVTFGNSTQVIGENAFGGCIKLGKAVIPDSVTEIGVSAFDTCTSLSDVTIGNGVRSIGRNAFKDTALWNAAEVSVYADNWFLGCKDANRQTFLEADFKAGTVGIASFAFWGCNEMYDVVLPNSIKYINSYAFSGCAALSSMIIGSGVVAIDDFAFNRCPVLSMIVLGSSDQDNGNLFGYKQSSLHTIGSYVFNACTALEQIIIPDTVTSIGTRAFDNSGIFNTQMGVVYADKWIVGDNEAMSTVVEYIKEDTVGIANYSFYNAKNINAQSLVLPDSIQTIGRGAFYACKTLVMITLPAGLKEIQDYTFYNCTMLAMAELPASLERIGRSAFYGCQYLGISAIDENIEVRFTIPDSVKSIGDYAFYGCASTYETEDGQKLPIGITTLNIGDGVETIGNNAFSGMSALKEVNIGNGVKSVGVRAFNNCIALETVSFGSGLSQISDRMFYNCSALKSVTFPANVKVIGSYAFYNCGLLTDIDFGGVENIGDYAFYGAAVKTLRFPSSVKYIGKQAFRNCKQLTAVYLTDSIDVVEAHAFYGCEKLTVYSTLSEAKESWASSWNSSFRPVIWSVTLSDDGSYVSSFVKSQSTTLNLFDKNTLYAPMRSGYTFAGWTTVQGGSPEYSAEELKNVPDGTTLYSVWTEGDPVEEEPEPDEPEESGESEA